MKNKLILLCLLVVFFSSSYAQFTRYIVRFKNKAATAFTLADPAPFLSQRAIDRRTHYNIAIDSSDLPVPSSYISQVKSVPGVTVLNVSRWLNAISISTSDPNAIITINSLTFVQTTSAIAAKPPAQTGNKYPEQINPLMQPRGMEVMGNNFFDYGTSSFNEIHIHEGEFLHNVGLRGQGMQVALLDGGFYQYTNFKAFDSANANGQFLDTWDFVAGEQSVVEDNSHGMSCLSTIAANIPGQFVGMAPKASFRLYRTEDVSSEYPIEEFNWACGAERADSAGADVISTSLGYNTFDNSSFDHAYNDMNGNIIMSTIAADLAAKKGMLVFVSAGNEGSGSWHYITSPADADSVIAVGAISITGTIGPFSSYGPSADGRIKPDVASVGVNAIIQTSANTIGLSNGTSFSAPKMAGLGTALWQGFPEFNNMRIVRAIKEAGSIYTSPNDRIGYGIPNMKTAFTSLLIDFATSSANVNGCNVTVNWTSKDVGAMKYEIERKAPGEITYTKVGEVTPKAGNILSNHNYQFTNTLSNVPTGTVSYRIRQIADTAIAAFTAVYIDTANVTITLPCAGDDADKVLIAPNPPAGDNAILVVQTSYEVNNMPIAVYDMKGSLIMQLTRSKTIGRDFFEIPINRLSKGKYIIKVYNNNKVIGSTDLIKL
jgi:serine protease AprX